MTTVIPGSLPESLLNHLCTAAEHVLSLTCLLSHSSSPPCHPYNVHNVEAARDLRDHLVLSCCRAAQRGQETAKVTGQGAEPKSADPHPVSSPSACHWARLLSSAEQGPASLCPGDKEAAYEPPLQTSSMAPDYSGSAGQPEQASLPAARPLWAGFHGAAANPLSPPAHYR